MLVAASIAYDPKFDLFEVGGKLQNHSRVWVPVLRLQHANRLLHPRIQQLQAQSWQRKLRPSRSQMAEFAALAH